MTADADARPERIEALDVLRGFAVLGILAVNAAAFSMPTAWASTPSLHPPAPGADQFAWAVVRVLFEAKFYALFSMLFGASVFLIGGDGSDPEANGRLRRRLLWLGAFGLVHGIAVWYGDILFTYALAGSVVMLARRWPPTTLLLVGIGVHVALGSIALAALPEPEAVWNLADQGRQAAAALSERGGYPGGFLDSLQANARDWLRLLPVGHLPAVLEIAPLMLIGLGLFKTDVLTARASTRLYVALAAVGGLYLAVLSVLVAREIASGHAPGAVLLNDLVNLLCAPLATLAYVSLLLLAIRTGVRPVARVLAPVGRMAFTNYLTQSLIMTGLFYGGRGPGLYAEMGHTALWGVVAGVWALQLAWSPWWLARFNYGPFEWVWRSLTLGRHVAMRRAA